MKATPEKKKTAPGSRAIDALTKAADAAVRKAPTSIEARLEFMNEVLRIREEFTAAVEKVWKVAAE